MVGRSHAAGVAESFPEDQPFPDAQSFPDDQPFRVAESVSDPDAADARPDVGAGQRPAPGQAPSTVPARRRGDVGVRAELTGPAVY